jgi:hypothetical protein
MSFSYSQQLDILLKLLWQLSGKLTQLPLQSVDATGIADNYISECVAIGQHFPKSTRSANSNFQLITFALMSLSRKYDCSYSISTNFFRRKAEDTIPKNVSLLSICTIPSVIFRDTRQRLSLSSVLKKNTRQRCWVWTLIFSSHSCWGNLCRPLFVKYNTRQKLCWVFFGFCQVFLVHRK